MPYLEALSSAKLTSALRLITGFAATAARARLFSLPLTRVNLVGKLPSAAPGIRQKQANFDHAFRVPFGAQPAPPALDMNDAFAHKAKGAD